MTPYYQDDAVTIYHGDCLDVIVAGAGFEATLLLTDPPYSLSVNSAHRRNNGNGTRRLDFFAGDQDWATMTSGVLARLAVATSVSGVNAAYVWCGHRQFGAIVESYEAKGFKTRPMAWRKVCPVPAPPGVGFDSALELCVYAFRPGRKWTPPTGAKVPNVIDADSYRHGQPGKVDHPTQKPIDTAAKPILYSTEGGDTVLDPFMGSGTTLRVAKDLGRRAIGIELEERYCEIAARRCAQEVLAL